MIDIRSLRFILAALVSTLAALTLATTALAAPGDLRARGSACVFSDLPTDFNDVAADGPRAIVAVGGTLTLDASAFYPRDTVVARFRRDGSLDASFATGGLAVRDFGLSDVARAVAVQPDGKIVVLAVSGQQDGDGVLGPYGSVDSVLARFEPDGSLDPSFGSGGTVRIHGLNALGLDPDVAAGILVSGWDGVSNRSVVRRYLPDGSPDPGFGRGGTAVLGGPGTPDEAIASGRHGGIVVAGVAADGGSPRFGLVRLTSHGRKQRSFSGDGYATVRFPVSNGKRGSAASAVDLLSDGRVVAAGDAFKGNGPAGFAVARLTRTGRIDRTFSRDGRVTTSFGYRGAGGVDYVEPGVSGLIAVNGNLIAVGSVGREFFSGKVAIARYRPDGSLDRRFGRDGRVVTGARGCISGDSAARLPGDRFVAGGFEYGCDEQEDGYEGPPNAGAIAVYER